LPNDLFLYALNEYWKINSPEQNSLAFENILHGPGSIGRVFGFTENALYERLVSLPRSAGMRFDTTAGMRNVYRTANEETLDALEILGRYYG